MAKRDIQAQYRQSFLGIFWAFAPIIANSLVWIFLTGSGTVNLEQPEIPYVLFVVIGTTLWTVFLESLQSPIQSVNAGKGILSKINFPKEALLIAGLYKVFFNLALKMLLIILFLVINKVMPTASLLYFPLFLFALIIFATAFGILLAPIGLLYTDIGRIINMAASFLMYATPVVFLAPKVGAFKKIFEWNPLTYLIIDGRNSLAGQQVSYVTFAVILTVASVVITLIGLVIFRKSMPILIEKIS